MSNTRVGFIDYHIENIFLLFYHVQIALCPRDSHVPQMFLLPQLPSVWAFGCGIRSGLRMNTLSVSSPFARCIVLQTTPSPQPFSCACRATSGLS